MQWIEDSSRTWAVKRKLALVMRFIFNTRAKKLNMQLKSHSVMNRHRPPGTPDTDGGNLGPKRTGKFQPWPEFETHHLLTRAGESLFQLAINGRYTRSMQGCRNVLSTHHIFSLWRLRWRVENAVLISNSLTD